MKQRLANVSVHQTAKVVAVLYGVLGLIFVPLVWLVTLADPTEAMPFWPALFIPVVYALIGYIVTALTAAIYNLVAGRLGGIEFTLVSESEAVP